MSHVTIPGLDDEENAIDDGKDYDEVGEEDDCDDNNCSGNEMEEGGGGRSTVAHHQPMTLSIM